MDAQSPILPWITLTIGIGGILLVTRLRRGSLVSPMSITLVMLIAIFGVRPIMMVANNRYNFYGGNNIQDGYQTAAWVGSLSVVFLLFGYFLGTITKRSQAPAESISPPPAVAEFSMARAASVALAVLGAWIILMAISGGGFSYLVLLFEGRGAGGETTVAGMPALVPALPVVAGIVMAFARIGLQRVRRITGLESLLYWIVIALTVIPPSALGSRRFLLPSLIAAVLGALPGSWFRLVTWRMAGLAFVGFLALSIIPFVRSSGSRTGDADLLTAMGDYFSTEGIGGTLDNFFLSYDTEMFNYVAFLATRLGASIEYGYGRGTIGEAILTPIPAALAPGERWSNEILIQAFGGTCGVLYCPVPSTSGIFFYDFGLPGVVLGMTLVGILMSRFEENFLNASGIKLISLLTLASFVPQIVRGNSIAQLWIATQVIVVLIAIRWITRKGSRARRSAQDQAIRSDPAHLCETEVSHHSLIPNDRSQIGSTK